jgi:hypothetical protein
LGSGLPGTKLRPIFTRFSWINADLMAAGLKSRRSKALLLSIAGLAFTAKLRACYLRRLREGSFFQHGCFKPKIMRIDSTAPSLRVR